ncbi:hypothetical protein ABVT39_023472 [Epinephelus coioides]
MLNQGHRFVLTSRFTQDCLENTFSCVRSKNPVPTPVEFHHALRIISVGQFLTTIRSGSYQEDDNTFLADFLDTVEQNVTPSVRVEQLMTVNRTAPDLTKTEKCILFHLAGYIIHKVIKFASICGKCKIAIEHNDDSPARENSTLVDLKEFKAGALCRPSQEAYDFIHKIEELFRTRTGSSFMDPPDAVGVLEQEAQPQPHCFYTYQHQANITAPPPTSTQPTTVLLHLPASSQHHCSSVSNIVGPHHSQPI